MIPRRSMEMLRSKLTATTPTSSDLEEGQNEAAAPSFSTDSRPFRERRPRVYASLKTLAIFTVSLIALSIILTTLLPPIDPQDKPKIKLPRSFDDLKQLEQVLQIYKDRNYYRVLGCLSTVYLFLQAFSIPGSMYLSILAGALFGVLVALPLVCFCGATGGLLCYLLSATLGPALLLSSPKWTDRLDRWKEKIDGQGHSIISYMIVLRISPLPPHWVVNMMAPHLGIGIWVFWISTFIGISGITYIHTTIGTTLHEMSSSKDFHLLSLKNALGLGGIIIAVLIPVIIRRVWAPPSLDDDTTTSATPVTPYADSPNPSRSPFVDSPRAPYLDSPYIDNTSSSEQLAAPDFAAELNAKKGSVPALNLNGAGMRRYSDREPLVEADSDDDTEEVERVRGTGDLSKAERLLGTQIN